MPFSPAPARPVPLPASRRLSLVLKWPIGLAAVTWRYMWRTTPIHRTECPGGPADLPDPVSDSVTDDDVQHIDDGVGPVMHRRYRVFVEDGRIDAATLLARFGCEPNRGAPAEAAVFVKTHGEPGAPRVGDEFLIRMPGPWDGPVRVIAVTPTSLRLATLRGHLEAGQIEFRAADEGGGMWIEIESWARAGDRLSHLLYNRLRLAKEIQLNLWVETCLRLAAGTGGRLRDGVEVSTRRVE